MILPTYLGWNSTSSATAKAANERIVAMKICVHDCSDVRGKLCRKSEKTISFHTISIKAGRWRFTKIRFCSDNKKVKFQIVSDSKLKAIDSSKTVFDFVLIISEKKFHSKNHISTCSGKKSKRFC
jgi:hypothetical protein